MTFWQNMKLFLCTLTSNLQHFSCNIYYFSCAKLTRTPLKRQVKELHGSPPNRWENHFSTPLSFSFFYIMLQHRHVHVIKGKFYYLSTQSLVLYILNIPVKTHLITPNGVLLFCFMDQTVQQSSLFFHTGGHRGDHDKR